MTITRLDDGNRRFLSYSPRAGGLLDLRDRVAGHPGVSGRVYERWPPLDVMVIASFFIDSFGHTHSPQAISFAQRRLERLHHDWRMRQFRRV